MRITICSKLFYGFSCNDFAQLCTTITPISIIFVDGTLEKLQMFYNLLVACHNLYILYPLFVSDHNTQNGNRGSISWTGSRDRCKDVHGGELASLHSYSDQQAAVKACNGYCWISPKKSGGRWRNDDGSSWDYTRWGSAYHPYWVSKSDSLNAFLFTIRFLSAVLPVVISLSSQFISSPLFSMNLPLYFHIHQRVGQR